MEENRPVDRLLKKEYKFGRINMTILDALFMFVVVLVGLYIRKQLIRITVSDWEGDFSVWFDRIKEYGGWRSLKYKICNYSCIYLYIWVIILYLPVEPLVAVKGVSILFDYLLAVAVMAVVLKASGSKLKGMVAFTVVVILPTVFMDGALWSQSDSIYVTFIVLSLLAILNGRARQACIWFGVAVSFKLQAVFFMPVLIIAWLDKRMRIVDFLWIPAVYLLTCIPSWALGRPIGSILGVYVGQASLFQELTLNYPNIYYFFNDLDENVSGIASSVGIAALIMIFGMLAYAIYAQKRPLDEMMLVRLSLLSALLCVYLLPHMHDRYGYLAEILSIVYALCDLRKMYAPVVIVLAGFCAYVNACFDKWTIPFNYLAVTLGTVLVLLVYDFVKDIKAERMNVENEG